MNRPKLSCGKDLAIPMGGRRKGLCLSRAKTSLTPEVFFLVTSVWVYKP